MTKNQSVRITFADGTSDVISTSGGAHSVIANRYGVNACDLVYETGDDRELVWLDEESAENDDGAHAVAEITAG